MHMHCDIAIGSAPRLAIARELEAEICALNKTQTVDFYKEIIREQNTSIAYPDPSRSN